MDINDVKAGDYELVSELFDQPKSKPEDKVFLFTRYRKGDTVTLDEEEAKRLVAAGAVVVPGERERAIYEAARAAYEAARAALPPDPGSADSEVVDPLAEMDLAELKAYAGAKGIDLGRATTEDGIRAKITESEQV